MAPEREALARRLGLLALDRLEAEVTAKPLANGRLVRVEGRLSADLVQECVVSLAPVPAQLAETFTAFFGEEEASADPSDEVDVPFDADLPEPIEDGTVDLGELVAQHLSLALDPYPRAPGARFEAPAAEGTPSPFAALAVRRGRR